MVLRVVVEGRSRLEDVDAIEITLGMDALIMLKPCQIELSV